MKPQLTKGSPLRLGAVAEPGGVNFAVFSAHATQIDLCLFGSDGGEQRLELPARTGDIWHGRVAGLLPGQRYGFRAHGPWAPRDGHLFNPAKLLIDPYARALDAPLVWDPKMTGHRGPAPLAGGHPCPDDSAPVVPKSLVMVDHPPAALLQTPVHLIYEAHVKGLTQRLPRIAPAHRGRYEALAAPEMVAHLKSLGVSHLELLPVTAFLDDRHVKERRLTNYWGYQPIAMMAPEPRYQGPEGPEALAAAVARLRTEGIGVILDVVFNHTGEGDDQGPTLCFRGLDNRSYYLLGPHGENINHTGTGNTLNLAHPAVLRLTMDALRHWAAMGVAGFRFDLASTLLRGPGGFDPGSAFLATITQSPVLNGMILIAEPWDLGPDGYRLGHFAWPFREWNDLFRDGVRRYWRGDRSQADLARRLTGSAELFDRGGRDTTASVNFLAAHDGFTLQDVVSYREKHNLTNGEDNRDGHHDNCSDNMGKEGTTRDAGILAARMRRKRAMLATLFLAQGTPMLLAGDEMGHTQRGNNNAYAQDNETSWIDWRHADRHLIAFVARLARLRRDHPVIGQEPFLHGEVRGDGQRDLIWRMPSGKEPAPEDWDSRAPWALCCEIRVNAGTPDAPDDALYAVFNAGVDDDILLPEGIWTWVLDTTDPDRAEMPASGRVQVPAQSVQLFFRPHAAPRESEP